MSRAKLIEKIKGKIVDDIYGSYEPIPHDDFKIGSSFFNHQCHRNTVQHATLHNSKIYMCYITTNGRDPVLHFVNKSGDSYQDNTLGYEWKLHDYWMIRKIHKSEYGLIRDTFQCARNTMIKKYISEFRIWINNIQPVEVI